MSVPVDNVMWLLSIPDKHSAITLLEAMLPKIDLSNKDVAEVLYKILPAFFGHLYLNKEKERILILITELMNREGVGSRLYLLAKWKNFLLTGEATLCTRHAYTRFDKCLGYEDIEFFLHVCEFLKYRKLHKYIYFFANLSYDEILSIPHDGIIDALEQKVELLPITSGGRGTIVRMVEELDKRADDLRRITNVDYLSLHVRADFDATMSLLIEKIRRILHTPFRKYEDQDLIGLLGNALTKAYMAAERRGSMEWLNPLTKLVASAIKNTYVFNDEQRNRLKALLLGEGNDESDDSNKESRGDDGAIVRTNNNSGRHQSQQSMSEVMREFEESFDRMVEYLERLIS